MKYLGDVAHFKMDLRGEDGTAAAEFFVFANVTLPTFDTGKPSPDIFYDAVLVTRWAHKMLTSCYTHSAVTMPYSPFDGFSGKIRLLVSAMNL